MTVTNFADTKAQQNYVVPAGVYYIKATTVGASGGNYFWQGAQARGGYGATVVSAHKVTPGETLYVNVGHMPTSAADTLDGRTSSQVFGGGGGGDQPGATQGNHGGGASDIRQGGTALANRIVVAGGGGGAGSNDSTTGWNGLDATIANTNSTSAAGGATPIYSGSTASQTSGGAGGPTHTGATENSVGGQAGTLGSGGGIVTGITIASGAGGGGLYGGGSGAVYESGPGNRNGYPGGGGSSRVVSGALISTTTVTQAGFAGATGSVVIDTAYVPATPVVTISQPPTTSRRIGFIVDIKELHPAAGGVRTVTYQLSQDPTFATGVIAKTVNFASGTIDGAVSGDPALNTFSLYNTVMGFWAVLNAQGTWYLRVQTGGDQNLPNSLWSANQTVTSTHVPGASVVSPTGSAYVQFQTNIGFRINITDPYAGDTMSAYQIVIENNATGATVLDTGEQLFAVPPPVGQTTINITLPGTAKDTLLRWKVRVWDSTNVVSAYSDYSLFTAVDPPTVTITDPSDGEAVTTGAPPISWTVTETAGRVPASTIVNIVEQATGTVVWERTLTGAVYTVTPETTVLINQVSYAVTVTVTDNVGLSNFDSNLFTTSYVSPDPILYTVNASLINTAGYVEINWSNQAPDSRLVAWRVYRRTLPDNTWELLEEISDSNVKYYRDYLVYSGQQYMWTVTQLADRSGALLESPVGTRAIGIGDPVPSQAEAQIELLDIDNYWIIDTVDPTLTMLIPQVTDAAETEEYDTADYNIVGRGRHRDYGDRLGYSGTLTSQVRIPERPSSVRLAAENLRAAQHTYYLRTPFGKLFQVALGNIGWTPKSGVGTVEMGDMTIPYVEVA